MLAVANSSLITRLFTTSCVTTNSTPAGARRDSWREYVQTISATWTLTISSREEAIECVRERVTTSVAMPDLDVEIDELVWRAFGLLKPIAG